MKLTRDDLTPILSILFAGALGVATTAAMLDSRASSVRTEARWTPDGGAVLRLEPLFETPPVPSYSYTVYGHLIEEIEALRIRQRAVRRQVEDLPRLSGDELAYQVVNLQFEKEKMLEALAALERRLDGAMNAQPSLGYPLRRAADYVAQSQLDAKIRYSRETLERWDAESALFLEEQIESDLVELREVLAANWSRR